MTVPTSNGGSQTTVGLGDDAAVGEADRVRRRPGVASWIAPA